MFLYYLFNTLLIMLLIFHIYWWILICAMIRRQLKNSGQVGEDIRSGEPIFFNSDSIYFCFWLHKINVRSGQSLVVFDVVILLSIVGKIKINLP